MDEDGCKCSKCKVTIQNVEQSIVCDACRAVFHITSSCSIVSSTEYRALVLKQRMVIFFCKECRDIFKLTLMLVQNVVKLQKEVLNIKEEMEALNQEVKNFKLEIKNLNEDNKRMTAQLAESTVQNKVIDKKCDNGNELSTIMQEIHERQSRASNVIISNIQESGGQNRFEHSRDDSENVKKILETVLSVIKTFRLGNYSANKNRLIKVILGSPKETFLVLQNRSSINIPGVKVFADQTKMQQQYYSEVKLNALIADGMTNKTIKYIKVDQQLLTKKTNTSES